MAAENYVRDVSEYLTTGILSDLVLNFGEQRWQIHKALACCHSKWFQKVVTGDFNESIGGVITLNDDPDFSNAIHCMVSYFYNAGYHASNYDTSESILHAQVATIADKYDCPSLYKLAHGSFTNTINAVEGDEWIEIAAFIYKYTTPELPSHRELRAMVVAAVANRPDVLEAILRMENTVELLRSNADLSTDLLLCGMHKREASDVAKVCPRCGGKSRRLSKRQAREIGAPKSLSCLSCDGMQATP